MEVGLENLSFDDLEEHYFIKIYIVVHHFQQNTLYNF